MTRPPLHIALDGEGWRLLKAFSFRDEAGNAYSAAAGFWFDGGSIPHGPARMVVCPMAPQFIRGFCAHDYCYWRARHGQHICDRKQADQIMLHQFHLDGADELRAHAIYRAVRMGSAWYWLTEDERAARIAAQQGGDIWE